MRHFPLQECGYAIAFVACLAALYGAVYLGAVEKLTYTTRTEKAVIVVYRFGGEWSVSFFAPAHEADRQLRHEHWRGEIDRESLVDIFVRQAMEESYFGDSKILIEPVKP